MNSTIAIKEPYYKYNGDGDYAIRVDHPSDIAVLRGDDPAVTMIMNAVSKTMEITSMEWKIAGDKAYLEKSYSSAIEWSVSLRWYLHPFHTRKRLLPSCLILDYSRNFSTSPQN
jgi:hypothetical protein